MKKNLALSPLEFTSSFLSCQNDLETILKKLFIESEPYSTELKKLLVINTKDCLDRNNIIYQNAIKDMSLARLKEQGYIRLVPKIQFEQHSEVKSYLLFSFDNFHPNRNNPMFRDCNVFIEAICNTECWDLGNFRSRPIKICGYVDAILNNAKLSGTKEFAISEKNLFKYNDYNDLTQKIEYFIENPIELKQCREEYIKESSKYRISTSVDNLLKMMEL